VIGLAPDHVIDLDEIVEHHVTKREKGRGQEANHENRQNRATVSSFRVERKTKKEIKTKIQNINLNSRNLKRNRKDIEEKKNMDLQKN